MSPPLLSKPPNPVLSRQAPTADDATPALYRVLFVCADNSAASIMAERVLADIGKGWFEAFSAGPVPLARPHALVLDVLASHGLPVDNIAWKSWTDFVAAGAPEMDIVVTLGAPGTQSIVAWPGTPIVLNWTWGDPAATEDDSGTQRSAIEELMLALQMRITLLVSIMIAEPADEILRKKLGQIWPAVGSGRPEERIHE